MEIKAFEKKIWLASPTMHGEEIEYVNEAYTTNWMSTVGKNINEVERLLNMEQKTLDGAKIVEAWQTIRASGMEQKPRLFY